MKKLVLALSLLLLSPAAFAANDKFFCSGDDGSDLSISVNLRNGQATLQGEDIEKSYALTGVLESLPMQYVFGSFEECSIQFQPSLDGQSGNATYSCNADLFPNALKLDFPCSVE